MESCISFLEKKYVGVYIHTSDIYFQGTHSPFIKPQAESSPMLKEGKLPSTWLGVSRGSRWSTSAMTGANAWRSRG